MTKTGIEYGPPDQAAQRTGPATRKSRKRKAALIAAVLLGTAAVTFVLLFLRYEPYVDTVRSTLATAQQVAEELGTLDPGSFDRPALTQLRAETQQLHHGVDQLRDLLASDPLIGLARSLPPVRGQLDDADALLSAATDLLQAADVGLDLGERLVELRESQATGAGAPLLSGLVEIMATSTGQVEEIGRLVDSADVSVQKISADALGGIRNGADMMSGAITKYRPILQAYQSIDAVLPEILGSSGPRRYLVLAQDPAELRPAGGFTGTVGVIAFDGGRVTELHFEDVFTLDEKPGIPYVQPPQALQDHLLGSQSWQLADATWSPDFPTSAQEALDLYTLESGDDRIDGVIALSTFALDEILRVIGPVQVPDYGVTVQPGDVTLTALANTRTATTPSSDRKAFLDSLATVAMGRVFAIQASQWLPMLQAFDQIANERMMLVWFKDEAAQSLVASGPIGGAIREDAGDYLQVVESNVVPTSKYNLVVHRSAVFEAAIQPDGAVENRLQLTWQNDAAMPGEPYASLRSDSTSQAGLYGAFVRVLTPANSVLVEASGNSGGPISGIESEDPEGSRLAFANYLLIAPGPAEFTYAWDVPGVAVQASGEWRYQLTIQKQPGMSAEPMNIAVTLPPGARVTSLPAGASISDGVVTLATTLTSDLQIAIAYEEGP